MEEVTAEQVKDYIPEVETSPVYREPAIDPDAEEYERENETEQNRKEIYCSVSKPEKIGEGLNAYVNYVVTTRIDDNHWDTSRRYSDFHWLLESLKSEFKHILVPPLPEKVIIDRFSPEIVEYRRKELERFLKRILNHPLLSRSVTVKTFLTASESAMEIERSKPKATAAVATQPKKEESKGWLASLSAGLTSVASAVTGPTVELKEVDPWFDTQKGYLYNLEQQLQVLVARSYVNTRKKQEMVSSLTDFAHAALLASGCEVGHDEGLAEFWGKLSEILNQMATLTDELAHGEIDLFEDQVKDYVRLVGACKDLMENRNVALLELQTCKADLALKSDRRTKNQGSSKTSTLAADLQDAQEAETHAEQNFNSMSRSVKSELEAFKINKGRDLRHALRELVRMNINHQLRVVNLWKELLNELEEKKL